jgi:hypothetical protein
MNLNKYTKDQLINKLKRLDNKNESNQISIISQIKSYFVRIWELILTFKTVLMKLTLISLIINLFKKYKLFRKFYFILNTIVMSIFSISLIDNFAFDFIAKFLAEIRSIFTNSVDYLSNTQFYKYLNNLFSNKEKIITGDKVIKEKIISGDKVIKENSNYNEVIKEKSKDNLKNQGVWTPTDSPQHKLSEWLKRKEENIAEESNEESVYSNYKRYLIIMGLVVGSCFVWVYFYDIKETGSNLKNWIQSFWGNGDPGNNNAPDLPPESRISQRAELERLVKEKTKETNEKISDLLVDKGKSKMSSPSLEESNHFYRIILSLFIL